MGSFSILRFPEVTFPNRSTVWLILNLNDAIKHICNVIQNITFQIHVQNLNRQDVIFRK